MRAFVLGVAEVAQRGVATFAISESFDILEQVGLGVGLAPMVCESHFRSAQCQGQCIHRQSTRHRHIHRPTDPVRKQIRHEGEIEPPGYSACHSSRCRFASGRSCSLARSDFFFASGRAGPRPGPTPTSTAGSEIVAHPRPAWRRVLASDTPPVREVIADGVNGLLTDFFDVSGMADKAESVLDRPADFRPLSAAGVRLVRERYSFDVCFPRIRDLYEDVVNSGVKGAPATRRGLTSPLRVPTDGSPTGSAALHPWRHPVARPGRRALAIPLRSR